MDSFLFFSILKSQFWKKNTWEQRRIQRPPHVKQTNKQKTNNIVLTFKEGWNFPDGDENLNVRESCFSKAHA